MPRSAKPLTALQVARAKPGKHFDGGGLMLVVGPASASWVLRYTLAGRRREHGLGPARGAGALGLAEARAKAAEARLAARGGADPVAERAA